MLMSQCNTKMPAKAGITCGQDGMIEHLQRRGARCRYCVHLTRVDLFDRFIKQLGNESDGAQGDGNDAGKDTRADDGNQQQAPDQ